MKLDQSGRDDKPTDCFFPYRATDGGPSAQIPFSLQDLLPHPSGPPRGGVQATLS